MTEQAGSVLVLTVCHQPHHHVKHSLPSNIGMSMCTASSCSHINPTSMFPYMNPMAPPPPSDRENMLT